MARTDPDRMRPTWTRRGPAIGERCISVSVAACFHTRRARSGDVAISVRAHRRQLRTSRLTAGGWRASCSNSAANVMTTHLLNIFAPESTPTRTIVDLSVFVLSITAVIFVVVASLLLYAI